MDFGTEQRNKRLKKKRNRILSAIALLFVVLVITGIISFAVYFEVTTVNVAGLVRYDLEQIITSLDIQVGDNIFDIDDKEKIAMLKSEYPYIDEVEVVRLLPDAIEFIVTETDPAFAIISSPTNYTLVSESMKVLEHCEGMSLEGVPYIVGMDISYIEEGAYLREQEARINAEISIIKANRQVGWQEAVLVLEEERERYVQVVDTLDKAESFYKIAQEQGLEEISYCDVSDELSLTALYDNKIILELGSELELEYKVEFAKVVIDELSENFVGTINTQTTANNGRVYTMEESIIAIMNESYKEGYY